jgi:transposase
MARREDPKRQALAESRTLNPHPEHVTDPAFTPGGFFDPHDLVQVKYEMVRQAVAEGVPPGRAAASFGLSRQSFYTAKQALADGGLVGLLPGKPGPKGGHKLTSEVLDFLEGLLRENPDRRPADLAAEVQARFGVTVHPRSVRRALNRRAADRTAAEKDATKSG